MNARDCSAVASGGRVLRRASVLCGAAAWLMLAVAPPAAAAQTHTVTMDGTAFSPATLTVKRGDRIVWANKDPFPHTATAANKAFDSKSIAAGKSWTYVASRKGTFEYVCTFHPTMKGRLVVE